MPVCIQPADVHSAVAYPQAPQSMPPSEFDVDKVRTTLKQFVRDWSGDGRCEREACYGPILDELALLFPLERWSVPLKSTPDSMHLCRQTD